MVWSISFSTVLASLGLMPGEPVILFDVTTMAATKKFLYSLELDLP